MPDDSDPIPNWQRHDLPPMLSRRFEFRSYAETRRFLDAVAKLSEETQHYPNLTFGKNYVSVTLDADGKKIGAEIIALAQRIDALAVPEE
ncbi:MAG: 4a-hydroxytetrahydrobiopterin dehydratase [Burkholderiales bacterium]|jgi:4a-hydroxytetrahydrobiopterin dehydratase|nr:4a-hydroxytetrahydrobiopterin dehydratase [Burkholderiales bacterium]